MPATGANAGIGGPVTIPEPTQGLGQLHATAEAGIQEALDAVREARSRLEVHSSPAELFEYAEAERSLRAALTAVRSAAMDLPA